MAGVCTFDVAVQSRVHLAIRFPDPDGEEPKGIFDMFFERKWMLLVWIGKR